MFARLKMLYVCLFGLNRKSKFLVIVPRYLFLELFWYFFQRTLDLNIKFNLESVSWKTNGIWLFRFVFIMFLLMLYCCETSYANLFKKHFCLIDDAIIDNIMRFGTLLDNHTWRFGVHVPWYIRPYSVQLRVTLNAAGCTKSCNILVVWHKRVFWHLAVLKVIICKYAQENIRIGTKLVHYNFALLFLHINIFYICQQ